jgi:hypothetical protein
VRGACGGRGVAAAVAKRVCLLLMHALLHGCLMLMGARAQGWLCGCGEWLTTVLGCVLLVSLAGLATLGRGAALWEVWDPLAPLDRACGGSGRQAAARGQCDWCRG